MRRNPRIAPDQELQYRQWTIPKNVSLDKFSMRFSRSCLPPHEQTPVGMSICHLHMDPEVYPEPYKFDPNRWIGNVDPRVNRNLVPFVKGSRNCLGLKYSPVPNDPDLTCSLIK